MESISSSESSLFRQILDQKTDKNRKGQRPQSAKPRTQGFGDSIKQPTQQKYRNMKQILSKRDSKTSNFRGYNDNERLIQEIKQLKQKQTHTQQENQVCKTKIQVFFKEMQKQEQIIEKLSRQIQEEQTNNRSEKSAKVQLMELRQSLRVKNEEIEKYKKDANFTRYMEKEQELQAHIDECTRLRNLLKEQLNYPVQQESQSYNQKIMESIEDQQKSIINLRKENAELNNTIKKMRDEKKMLKRKNLKQLDNQSILRDNYISKEKYFKIKKKVKHLKSENNNQAQQIQEKDKQIYEMDRKIQEKENYANKIDQRLMEKEKQVSELVHQKDSEKTEKYEISNQKEKQINELWRDKIRLEEKSKLDDEKIN